MMCTVFATCLKGVTLVCYNILKAESIDYFKELVIQF